ncbi:hypothetical protein MUN82_08635 [Hymenobacter aerilatus]|uniref:Uncharacterized protein n=1 Tax=Hymenobacter aerilatus TaxID=2932251 RepID=A0A8T9T5M9_9BACT|nr:hypothetical protein [Hymenobacter aerilatus]UOR07149.1 hypothetical protein MUN82_08635 [Hymenobacter aerilatus]
MLLTLLLQATPDPATVAAVAQAMQKQSGQTTDLLRDYGALVNLLYTIVIVLGVMLVAVVYYSYTKVANVASAVETAVKAAAAPAKEAYEKALAEASEKHAQEIRANETHAQAQMSAQAITNQLNLESLSKQLEAEREDRRKLTETANNAYREMNEIVAPFTHSNHALAGRMHDVEKALLEFGTQVRAFATKSP